jgi:hypothetical protein
MPGLIRVEGWTKAPKREWVGSNRLTAKILCTEHNTALRDLDDIALRFFDFLDRSTRELGRRSTAVPLTRAAFFHGHDLERWLLKVLIGGVGEVLHFPPERSTDTAIPDAWLRVLFGLEGFAAGQGLYVPTGSPLRQFGRSGSLAWTPIGSSEGLAGVTAIIDGYPFDLIMRPGGNPRREGSDTPMTYRPMTYHIEDGSGSDSVKFTWEGESDRKSLHFMTRAADSDPAAARSREEL